MTYGPAGRRLAHRLCWWHAGSGCGWFVGHEAVQSRGVQGRHRPALEGGEVRLVLLAHSL